MAVDNQLGKYLGTGVGGYICCQCDGKYSYCLAAQREPAVPNATALAPEVVILVSAGQIYLAGSDQVSGKQMAFLMELTTFLTGSYQQKEARAYCGSQSEGTVHCSGEGMQQEWREAAGQGTCCQGPEM